MNNSLPEKLSDAEDQFNLALDQILMSNQSYRISINIKFEGIRLSPVAIRLYNKLASKRLKPIEIVDEYEKIVFNELDLLKEASNANLLKRNFVDSNYLYVPEIYWDLTRQNVLVMERIFGIQISNIEGLNKNNINIIVPHVTYSSEMWHRQAYEWLAKNKDRNQNLNIYFKMRPKTLKLNKWNLEFEDKLKTENNVHFVYDVLFYTNRKLLENSQEIVFVSNQTLYITECMKLQLKCTKTYDEPFEFQERYKTLVDNYIRSPIETRDKFISPRSHYSEYFFNEISKIF